MKTLGDKLDAFRVLGIKPGFNQAEENALSAFDTLTEASFPGKWQVIYSYGKTFSPSATQDVAAFARLAPEFDAREAVLLAGSAENEFAALAWRAHKPELSHLNHYQFADPAGQLLGQLGGRATANGLVADVTAIIDPDNLVQLLVLTPSAVVRSPEEILRVLDALQQAW